MANETKNEMAITPKGLKLLLAGLIVMISGYMLMCGQTFINNTIEALVEEARPELVAEVAKMMFPA